MKSWPVISLLFVLVLTACGQEEVETAAGAPAAPSETAATDRWSEIQKQRRGDLEQYLQQEEIADRWFDDFPFRLNDGVPYLIVKLLPHLAPELWGDGDNFLAPVGLFHDERLPDYPVARGIGWSGLARDDPNGAVYYASFTCGACHIGRVRTDSGMEYMDGGVNAHFNLAAYRVRAQQTVAKIAGDAGSQDDKVSRSTGAILAALDQVHGEDSNFFYGNYSFAGRKFDAAYEKRQIALFKQDAQSIVKRFMGRTGLESQAYGALLNKNYSGFGPETDIRIAAFAEGLLENLPAPVYPFSVDMARAEKGRALYEQNCAGCHKPHNGSVYPGIGTNSGRAHVASETITAAATHSFPLICAPDKGVDMPGTGEVKPCAEFEGVSLVGRAEMAMMDPDQHLAYNALPLGGIWAQAPYLHNGSVPTLYHLLVPQERPAVFMKSRLDYDTELVGFSWRIGDEGAAREEEGYRFDTGAIPAFSNAGHDKDITIDGITYRLNWTGDKDAAMAIIGHMKTL